MRLYEARFTLEGRRRSTNEPVWIKCIAKDTRNTGTRFDIHVVQLGEPNRNFPLIGTRKMVAVLASLLHDTDVDVSQDDILKELAYLFLS